MGYTPSAIGKTHFLGTGKSSADFWDFAFRAAVTRRRWKRQLAAARGVTQAMSRDLRRAENSSRAVLIDDRHRKTTVYLRKIMAGILGAIVAVLVLALLYHSVRATTEERFGAKVVRYGKPFKILVCAFWAFVVAAVLFVALSPIDWSEEMIPSVVIGAVFVAMVLSLHLEFFGVDIQFDDDAIRTRSPWRRHRTIPWTDVTKVSFSSLAQWFVIHTNAHGAIRCHLFLSGLNSFLQELKRRGHDIPLTGHGHIE